MGLLSNYINDGGILMSTIVVYRSITGFTEKYAKWIADDLKCDCKSIKDVSKGDLEKYDTVIFGGRVEATKIRGLGKAKRDCKNKLIVFAVGIAPEDYTEAIDEYWKHSFNADELAKIPHFYFRGGMNYDDMNNIEVEMAKMIAHHLNHKKNETPEQKDAADALLNGNCDFTDPNKVIPLVNLVK